eukprot:3050983-Rhodomonas_salina.7
MLVGTHKDTVKTAAGLRQLHSTRTTKRNAHVDRDEVDDQTMQMNDGDVETRGQNTSRSRRCCTRRLATLQRGRTSIRIDRASDFEFGARAEMRGLVRSGVDWARAAVVLPGQQQAWPQGCHHCRSVSRPLASYPEAPNPKPLTPIDRDESLSGWDVANRA